MILRAWWMLSRFMVSWIALFGWRFRAYGIHNVPRSGAVILACNHQSFFDPVLVAIHLPRSSTFMARDTLFKFAPFAFLIRSLNAFPIRRGAGDVGAMKESLRRLRDGWSLLVFPEGTRTVDGSLGEIRGGIAVLAGRARVPVVPVYIRGAVRAWPRGSRFPRPAPIEVRYGEPLAEADAWNEERFPGALRAALEGLSRDRRPTVGLPPAPALVDRLRA